MSNIISWKAIVVNESKCDWETDRNMKAKLWNLNHIQLNKILKLTHIHIFKKNQLSSIGIWWKKNKRDKSVENEKQCLEIKMREIIRIEIKENKMKRNSTNLVKRY